MTCNGHNQPLAVNNPATTTIFPYVPNYGVLNESTVGLNWWWNRYTRVQFNWIHSMPNYQSTLVTPAVGAPFATPSGYAPFDIFAARFQIEF
jgi:hypothetical protein